jgi:hypothetical protein
MGIFRLTRGLLDDDERTRAAARAGAWLAALVYGANPNLIYLQTTAMTEPLYLALFIWSVVFFAEFWRPQRHATSESKDNSASRRPLYRCALCVAGAELTRYDGWFLAAAMGAIVFFLLLRRWSDRNLRIATLTFLVSITAAPLLWLAYNAAVYGNPIEFANGPYSAKAIEQRTAQPGFPAHPGAGNLVTAASFFLKSAELNMAEGNWGRVWIAIALAGSLAGMKLRLQPIVLLLWTPVVFYALSIAYSGVPLFLPSWWPFTWYNLRYGLQLLPLFSLSSAFLVSIVLAAAAEGTLRKRLTPLLKGWPDRNLLLLGSYTAILVIIVLSYGFVWRAQPLCFTEAWINSRTKLALESSVAKAVAALPAGSTYLMYIGDHVGVFQQAGVPLRQIINEGNHRPWKRPADPEGLWEQALADPGRHVDFVIAYEGDAIDQSVQKKALALSMEIHTLGQPRARIYAARSVLNQPR